MNIRKFLVIVVTIIISMLLLLIPSYRYFHTVDNSDVMEEFNSNYRFIKIEDETLNILDDKKEWNDFNVKGIELDSFLPQDQKNKSSISKAKVLEWLEDIYLMNINTITINGIQPSSFYNAIYDFNENSPTPIFTIHEINLDEHALLEFHDIYHPKVIKNLQQDIERTVNVVHGKELILNNKRGSSGLYLNDISQYNMGYIITGETKPEIITLSNSKYHEINSYQGENFTLNKGTPYEAFVAESLDKITIYEKNNYEQVSLVSYALSLDTDSLDYQYETELSKDAQIDLNKIKSVEDSNLFLAYKYHPSDGQSLDGYFETNEEEPEVTTFYQQLLRVNDFYKMPVLITDTGISSSRNMSKVDLNDGFNRGGFNEHQQGKKLVELLSDIEKANLSGFVINSWKDTWSKRTPYNLVEDFRDLSASSSWHNVLASDENFGLMAFERDDEDSIIIDGDFKDWEDIDYLLDDDIKMKVDSDTKYLYLYLESNQNIKEEEIYLGLDITPTSGSNSWDAKNVEFSIPVDFILDLSDLDESRVLTQKRYDRFTYFYSYYSNVVGKSTIKPDKDSSTFSPIYGLNRREMLLVDEGKMLDPIYSEIGKLKQGNADPLANGFNSLADFQHNDNAIEIRIPYAMINIINPIDMLAYGDFYDEGLEEKIRVKDIGFSIYNKANKQPYEIKNRYRQKRFRSLKYKNRLKDSYYIIQEYLNSQ